MCRTSKIPYPSRAAATEALKRHPWKSARKGRFRMTEYRCDACGMWHLGHLEKKPPTELPIISTTPRARILREYIADARRQAATKAGITPEVRAAVRRAELELAVLDVRARKAAKEK